jgi:RNA recognition motif-containing protein
LSLTTTDEDIKTIFCEYGTIENCRIVMDQKRNKSRGFCFVTFEKREDAISAKEKAHGKTIDDKE